MPALAHRTPACQQLEAIVGVEVAKHCTGLMALLHRCSGKGDLLQHGHCFDQGIPVVTQVKQLLQLGTERLTHHIIGGGQLLEVGIDGAHSKAPRQLLAMAEDPVIDVAS
eukprot:1610242-Lingulodinium_polyedra.AAC.1